MGGMGGPGAWTRQVCRGLSLSPTQSGANRDLRPPTPEPPGMGTDLLSKRVLQGRVSPLLWSMRRRDTVSSSSQGNFVCL